MYIARILSAASQGMQTINTQEGKRKTSKHSAFFSYAWCINLIFPPKKVNVRKPFFSMYFVANDHETRQSDRARGIWILRVEKGIRDTSPEDGDRDEHRNREQCTGKNLMAELKGGGHAPSDNVTCCCDCPGPQVTWREESNK